jgi:phenylacetate-CoA ligase
MGINSYLRRNLFIPLWVWKDGSPRLDYLKEMEQTQYFDPARLRELQFVKLTKMIRYAYNEVPLYRKRFDEHGVYPNNIKDFRDLTRFPLLTKKDLRDHPEGFIADRKRGEALIPFKTGGSTGKSVTVYYDFDSMERMVGSSLRSFRWSGWDLGEPTGRIWGNPPELKGIKTKLRNTLIEPQIFLDTMRLDDGAVRDFAVRWRSLKPTLLHGHSHSLYMFAKYCLKLSIDKIRPKGIISTSMMLIPSERRVIEEAFDCPVTDLYGSEEVGLMAAECQQHRGMHINMENNFIEIVNDAGQPVAPGQEGAIVITTLWNKAMPLIRYKIEDVGVISDRTCPCGRGLTILEEVRGRIADFIVRRDGSLVAGVSLVERTLTAFPGIDQMQIVQKELDDIVLNIVRGAGFSGATEQQLRDEFEGVFGSSINLVFNYVIAIAPEQNGKFRFSISMIENTYSGMQ